MGHEIEVYHPGNRQVIEADRCAVDSIKYRTRKYIFENAPMPAGSSDFSIKEVRDYSHLKLSKEYILKPDIAEGKSLVLFPDVPYWLITSNNIEGLLKQLRVGTNYSELKTSVDNCDELIRLLHFSSVLSVDGRGEEIPLYRAPHLAMSDNTALLSLTLRCNLMCPHCVASANENISLKDELSTEEVFSLLDQIEENMGEKTDRSYKIESKVFLSGGEPFCRKDIMEIIRYACSKRLTINICTNSLLLNDRVINELANLSVSFSISLDGDHPETHERIRGLGTFFKTLENIKKITSKGKVVFVNTFLHQDNFGDMEGLLELSKDIGVQGINFIHLLPRGRGHDIMFQAIPQTEIFRRLNELSQSDPVYYSLIRNENCFPNLAASIISGVKSRSCGTARENYFYVSYLGDIFPCPGTNSPNFKIGNIKEKPLSEILETSQARKMLSNLQIDCMNPTCGGCEFRYFCGGDCRGTTYRLTGNINAPNPFCLDRKESIMLIFKSIAKNPELFREKANEFAKAAKLTQT